MAGSVTWRAGGGPGRSAGADVGDDGDVSGQRLLKVWEKALPALERLVAGMGCGPGTGEDVLQDVYLSALRSGIGPLGPAELTRWLYRVTINRCRQEHRWRARLRRAAEGLFRRPGRPSAADAGQELSAGQQRQAVRQALADMPESLKVPLVMRYFCEMDSRQIGQILALPDSTVRSRLRAGRMKLADALIKAGYGDD